MLGSITPLGERGRHSRWMVTIVFYIAGSTAAGLAMGGLLGAAGGLGLGTTAVPRLWVLAAAGAVGLAMDVGLFGMRLPSPRRQVNEAWLRRYRGWVYGLGFGLQLGLGVVTIVTSSAVYLTLAAAILSGSARAGALIMGTFGLIRAATGLAAADVRGPARLGALDARLRRWERPSHRLALLAQAALLVAAVAMVVGA